METPAQMCVRLATALEDLAAQEAASVQTRDFTAVIEIQRRAAPLVDALVAHGPDVADQKLRARIAALVTRRNETGAWLSAEIEHTRERLRSVEASQRRAAQLRPVYGGGAAVGIRRKLQAIG